MVDIRRTMLFPDGKPRALWLTPLHGDVGNEQLVLGCLPSVTTGDGRKLKFEITFYQPKGQAGQRLVLFEGVDCPAQTPVTFSLKTVMLLPPSLSAAERKALSAKLCDRESKGDLERWKGTKGFPEPDFKTGGLSYVEAAEGKTPFATIHNVLLASNKLMAESYDPKYLLTLDPDTAKANKKGACTQITRIAEKSLAGVARARFIGVDHETADNAEVKTLIENIQDPEQRKALDRYPAIGHALLVIEDPEGGGYFVGDAGLGYIGPHTGDLMISGLVHPEAIPEELFARGVAKPKELRTLFTVSPSGDQLKGTPGIVASASSRVGKDAPKYQAWLKNVPTDFRDLEKKYNEQGTDGTEPKPEPKP